MESIKLQDDQKTIGKGTKRQSESELPRTPRAERKGKPVPSGMKRVKIVDRILAKIAMINGTGVFTLHQEEKDAEGKVTDPGTLGYMNQIRAAFETAIKAIYDRFIGNVNGKESTDQKDIDSNVAFVKTVLEDCRTLVQSILEEDGDYDEKIAKQVSGRMSNLEEHITVIVASTGFLSLAKIEDIVDTAHEIKNRACEALVLPCAEQVVPQ